MSKATQFTSESEGAQSDGVCAKPACVVIDPAARSVTHRVAISISTVEGVKNGVRPTFTNDRIHNLQPVDRGEPA
jgi:hypothetical protein